MAAPVFSDEGVVAILDASTGSLLREVTTGDLRRAVPDASLFVDESLHLHGDDLVVTTESHAFLLDPRTGEVVRSREIPPHAPSSIALGDGRIAFPAGPDSSLVLDPWAGRARRENGAILGASQDGRHVLTSITTETASGVESSLVQLRDAGWRRRGPAWRVRRLRTGSAVPAGGPRGRRGAGRGAGGRYDIRTGALVRVLPGHSGALMQMALAGPERDLIWTAGRDGTAVAFDLSGRRGVLRRLPVDVVAGTGAAAAGRALMVNTYDTELNTASVIDLGTGKDLFGEIQPVTSCTCQAAQSAITPDGRRGLVAVVEFTEDFQPVTDHGRVAVIDTSTGALLRTIETPWEASRPRRHPGRRPRAGQRQQWLGAVRRGFWRPRLDP